MPRWQGRYGVGITSYFNIKGWQIPYYIEEEKSPTVKFWICVRHIYTHLQTSENFHRNTKKEDDIKLSVEMCSPIFYCKSSTPSIGSFCWRRLQTWTEKKMSPSKLGFGWDKDNVLFY